MFADNTRSEDTYSLDNMQLGMDGGSGDDSGVSGAMLETNDPWFVALRAVRLPPAPTTLHRDLVH